MRLRRTDSGARAFIAVLLSGTLASTALLLAAPVQAATGRAGDDRAGVTVKAGLYTTMEAARAAAAARSGIVHPNGFGRALGDCGVSQLSTNASLRRVSLTLLSSQGEIGTGSYTITTNGFGNIPSYGNPIDGRGHTVWLGPYVTIIPGLFPIPAIAEATVSGWVTTARAGICFYFVSAPWNDSPT